MKNTRLIPLYDVGDRVFAISMSNDTINNSKQAQSVDEWDRNYARIYEVIIEYISIDVDGVNYMLKGLDGTVWGDSVSQDNVSTDLQELFNYLRKRWAL